MSPAAARATFLAAHRAPFSTAQLITLLRATLGRPSRLFSMPPRALEAAAALTGRAAAARRLTRSLEVETAPTEDALGWSAQVSIEDAAREIGNAYRAAIRA